MSTTNKEIIDRIETMEVYAKLILEEAIKLRKSLSPVEGRTPRKGLSKEDKAKILARRNKTAFKK